MLVFGQHCIGGGDELEASLPTDSNTNTPLGTPHPLRPRGFKQYLSICLLFVPHNCQQKTTECVRFHVVLKARHCE